MRLQIDTGGKTIRVESNVGLKELFDNLNVMFPKKEWEGYTLETNVVINWTSPPTIYPAYPVNPYLPTDPYQYQRWDKIWCGADTQAVDNTGIYNLEITG